MTHATDSMNPFVRQMYDAADDRARAAVLLMVPDKYLAMYRPLFERACRRAGFDLGLSFIAVRRSEWNAVRGPDGRHKQPLFDQARREMASYACGGPGDRERA